MTAALPGTFGTAALLRTLGGSEASLSTGEAWQLLVGRHGSYVWQICWRILGDHELSEEATQDLWLRVRAKAHQFRGAGPAEDAVACSWLAHLAATCALQLLRRRRREQARRGAWGREPLAPHADPDERKLAVRQALEVMAEDDSAALSLRFLADLAYDDMGRVLGCTPGAARVRVHRALGRLRRQLQGSGSALAWPGDAAVPMPTHLLAHWQGLLASPLHPTTAAPIAASITGLTPMAKCSLAAASFAAVMLTCGSAGHGDAVEAASAPAPTPSATQLTPTIETTTVTIGGDTPHVLVNGWSTSEVRVFMNGKAIDTSKASGAVADAGSAGANAAGGTSVAKVERIWLGAETDEVSPVLDHQLHLPEDTGLQVEAVAADGPAATAGIKRYDVLTHLDGQELHDRDQLAALLEGYPAGKSVPVRLMREGKELELDVVLARHLEDAGGDAGLGAEVERRLQRHAERILRAQSTPAHREPPAAGASSF